MKKIAMTIALIISTIFGAAIWALSLVITGETEPWDAQSAYYYSALFVAGFILGIIRPVKIWIYPFGIYIGQLLYAIIVLPKGPLIAVGIILLAVNTVLSLAGAIVGLRLRQGIKRLINKES